MDLKASQNEFHYTSQQRLYFQFLAYLAGILLWGSSILNGSVKALLVAAWTGQIGDTITLKLNYTGIPIIDYFIAVLVCFFFPGTSGRDEGYQLFVVDAFSGFALAFVWLHIEASRPGKKPAWIMRPMMFGILWQLFGAAIILPIYFFIHLQWSSEQPLQRIASVGRARALTPTFLLGVVVPTAVVMAPTWLGPDQRSVDEHQSIIALFLLSPFWVSGLMTVATQASAWFRGGSSSKRLNQEDATRWVQAVHLQSIFVSAAVHLYVMMRISTADNPDLVNLTHMYIPYPITGPVGVTDVITRGSWLFLQYDHIIISLSSLSWAVILFGNTPIGAKLGRGSIILLSLIGSMVIGPGATVSLALYLREFYLAEALRK